MSFTTNMTTLRQTRSLYIQAATMEIVERVSSALLDNGVIVQEEYEAIQSERTVSDKARYMLDVTMRKGTSACDILMDAWNDCTDNRGTRVQCAKDLKTILLVLLKLSSYDLEGLVFYMKYTPTDDVEPREPNRKLRDSNGKMNIRQLSLYIADRYGDNGLDALDVLLPKISRNDLVRKKPQEQVAVRDPEKWTECVLKLHQAKVMIKTVEVLKDLTQDQMGYFTWMSELSKKDVEDATTPYAIAEAIMRHVKGDTTEYMTFICETLRSCELNVHVEELMSFYSELCCDKVQTHKDK